jgi:hypothetical protein
VAPHALPRWIKPQLTKLADAPPDGPTWLHEIKFDGYRLHARLDRGNVYVIRPVERDTRRDYLRASGIGTGILYPVPVYRQPAGSGRLAPGPSGLGVTEQARGPANPEPADLPAALRRGGKPRRRDDSRPLMILTNW